MTPKQFVDKYLGRVIDYDRAYGAQCVDAFKVFCAEVGIPVKATPNDLADGYWYSRYALGYAQYFTFVTDGAYKDGDWIIWSKGSKSHPKSHIAMMYQDQEFSENQGGNRGFSLKNTVFSDALGALRWIGWGDIPFGYSFKYINGRHYSLYRQDENEETVVISAGLNKLKPIRELDIEDRYVMCKITGGNYFQMKSGEADPYGTTYGDLSAPLCEVWRELPNQDTTLYYDLETGAYGDCTGVHIDQKHNVFSPAVVYPKEGHYQYARMVGIGHINVANNYSFVMRMQDGTYVLGLCEDVTTPKTIATDLKTFGYESIAFLDGGGSAQMGAWNGKSFTYYRDTGREVPSAIAILSKVVPVEKPVEKEEEEEPMTVITPDPVEEVTPVENWTDPEPVQNEHIILQRIASLMSVKSIITIFLTVVFGMLVLKGEELPDKFVSIYTMCISFFFGYQFKKAESEK